MKRAIKRFLKPDWRKILIFAVFLFIGYAASIQSWVFAGREAGMPKPPLYDLFEPFPFWVVWAYITLPLRMLSQAIIMISDYRVGFGYFWTIQIITVIYLYILSCLVIFVWDKSKSSGN